MIQVQPALGGRLPWALAVGALLFVLWLLLGGGQGPVYGLMAATAGAGIGSWLAPGTLQRLRLRPLLRFAALFVVRSVVGGIDISWRALHPAMPLQPTWIRYDLGLQKPAGRALFMITISLTPGTLCAEQQGGEVHVHALGPDMERGLREIENAIAAVFGESPRGPGA